MIYNIISFELPVPNYNTNIKLSSDCAPTNQIQKQKQNIKRKNNFNRKNHQPQDSMFPIKAQSYRL
jgi:hypothetical protein